MGMYHSTYFAYGARIPDLDPEVMQEKLTALKEQCGFSVGYLHAGDYDRDMTFLVTECEEVDLGKSKVLAPQDTAPEQYVLWNGRIRDAAAALGIDPLHAPGWFVVPDLS